MSKIFYQDFIDFLQTLNSNNVEYILVGGYAVILHGYHRTTGDLDVWVNPTKSNYHKLIKAFNNFGLPESAISESDFLDSEQFDVFTFGRPPISIDLMTKVKGLIFKEAYEKVSHYETQGIKIKLINYGHLIEAKKASNRYRDLNDIEHLEQE